MSERLGKNPLRKPLKWIGEDAPKPEVAEESVVAESAVPAEPEPEGEQKPKRGRPKTRDKMVHKHFELPEDLNEKLRLHAFMKRKREVEIVRQALELYFETENVQMPG